MQQCEHEERASLYALGLLDEAESNAFALHAASCSICANEVRASGDLAAQLAGTIPGATPPATLRTRVLSEAVLPRGVVALVRGGTLNWQATSFAGVSIARLYEDPVRGELASLVRMSPGARYPSHRHGGLEHCYVIEGDVVFDDHTMTAGDYSAGSPDTDHSAATTQVGCMLFLIHNSRDQVHQR
jgi:anti-sigma factor ChrR (cupin superfamily)